MVHQGVPGYGLAHGCGLHVDLHDAAPTGSMSAA
jgi:hypothetical protein